MSMPDAVVRPHAMHTYTYMQWVVTVKFKEWAKRWQQQLGVLE